MIATAFKTLKVGDVRRDRDEVRHTQKNANPYGNLTGPFKTSEWEPVQLVGHKILQSDLMAAEFRRPLL